MVYKWCVVPLCKSTSIKTPHKLFVSVPTNRKKRKMWLELARRDSKYMLSNSNVFMCEDHFNMEKDTINYMKYKMGFSQKILLADEAVPTKFHCQEDRKRGSDVRCSRKVLLKRQRIGLVSECQQIQSATETRAEPSQTEANSIQEIIEPDDTTPQTSDVSKSTSQIKSDVSYRTRFPLQKTDGADDLSAVCRVCLAVNVRMYHISQHKLRVMYERVTGVEVSTEDKLPQKLCLECTARLSSAYHFVEKALKTQRILLNKIDNSRVITKRDIKLIEGDQNNLNTTLSCKNNKVNDYNLHKIEGKNEISNKYNRTNVTIIQSVKSNSNEDNKGTQSYEIEENEHSITTEVGTGVENYQIKREQRSEETDNDVDTYNAADHIFDVKDEFIIKDTGVDNEGVGKKNTVVNKSSEETNNICESEVTNRRRMTTNSPTAPRNLSSTLSRCKELAVVLEDIMLSKHNIQSSSKSMKYKEDRNNDMEKLTDSRNSNKTRKFKYMSIPGNTADNDSSILVTDTESFKKIFIYEICDKKCHRKTPLIHAVRKTYPETF